MALEAGFWLFGVWLGILVNGVARYTGDVILLVVGTVPEHQFLIFTMAGLTLCILFFCTDTFSEANDIAFGWVGNVGVPAAVAREAILACLAV